MVRPAGIEPARLTAADFLTRYCSRSRIASGQCRLGSGLCLDHRTARHDRCRACLRSPPSSLYTRPAAAIGRLLGSAFPCQGFAEFDGFYSRTFIRGTPLVRKSATSTNFVTGARALLYLRSPLRADARPQGAMGWTGREAHPPTPFGRPLKGAMRVDRRSPIHRILDLGPPSWIEAPVLRWLPAVATVWQLEKAVLDPGRRGSGFAGPPAPPP